MVFVTMVNHDTVPWYRPTVVYCGICDTNVPWYTMANHETVPWCTMVYYSICDTNVPW